MNSNVSQRVKIFLAATAYCLTAAAVALAAPPPPSFVVDELLVQAKAGVGKDKFEAALDGLGATNAEDIPQIRVKKIKVPPQALEKVKAALAKNPHVKFVENNYLATSATTPDDLSYASQWHLPKISAPTGWDISTGSPVVDIAVIDSGIDPSHPDLNGKLLPGYNFVGGNTDTHDIMGHGTAVAGAAAAIGNNSIGVAGVAWQNKLMPLVVLDATNYASYSNIANAVLYAADHGVRVINISIAGSSSSTTLQNAINYAWNKGVIIIAAAANNSTSTPYYPAACANVMAISATTSSDTLASFSNYGSWITLSAPGTSIYTTNNGGGYGAWNGTSFSSPITAGLAALVLSTNPLLSNAQAVDIMKQNADDIGTAGVDPSFGYGRINVYKSLTAARNTMPQTDTTAPAAVITAPASGTTLSGAVQTNVSATDNLGVTKVELYVNDSLIASDTTAPYSFYWDTTDFADGNYTLYAIASDAAGNAGQSSQVHVTIRNSLDTIAPVASISSPANGVSIAGVSKVVIAASATDNVGVTRLELYIDGSLKSSSTAGSLSWNWNTRKVASGAHVILVKAYDSAGNVGVQSITVYR